MGSASTTVILPASSSGVVLVQNGSPGPAGPGAAAGTVVPMSATPPDHTVSAAYVDTSTVPPVLKGWDGTTWVALGTGGGTSGFTVVDNGDGTATVTATGTASIVDNSDGTATVTGGTVTDNNDGTLTFA